MSYFLIVGYLAEPSQKYPSVFTKGSLECSVVESRDSTERETLNSAASK